MYSATRASVAGLLLPPERGYGLAVLSRSLMFMLLNSFTRAVASNFYDCSICSCFFFNFVTTSSLFSFALKIKFCSDMFGAIELNGALQKGHFFLTFAYVLIHYLQYVCPQGNSMNG